MTWQIGRLNKGCARWFWSYEDFSLPGDSLHSLSIHAGIVRIEVQWR